MLFATQKPYLRRQRQRGGEWFDVENLVLTGLDPVSYISGCMRHCEHAFRGASKYRCSSSFGKTASRIRPRRQRWARSNTRRVA